MVEWRINLIISANRPPCPAFAFVPASAMQWEVLFQMGLDFLGEAYEGKGIGT